MPPLQKGTYPVYMENYIRLVEPERVRDTIEKYSLFIKDFFEDIPEEKVEYRYAGDKWSIKEMLQHIIDAERIFSYRALAIARGDKTPLPGFDENSYAAGSKADKRHWDSLLEEFKAVRTSTDMLLLSFTEEQLQLTGITNSQPNTVNAIAFVIFGHILHHINVLKERYL
jgi:uncharacterized damage-inducible protein DinB